MSGADLPLLAATLATNELSISEVVDRVVACDGRTVALLGLSFKMDTDDLRESPNVELAERLIGKGFDVRIYDQVVNPARLVGANRRYVDSKLPHLAQAARARAADMRWRAPTSRSCPRASPTSSTACWPPPPPR